MAYRPPDSVIEYRLTRAFPAARLRVLARESDLVKRRRKLDAAALFWALTLGFAADEDRSLASPASYHSFTSYRRSSSSSSAFVNCARWMSCPVVARSFMTPAYNSNSSGSGSAVSTHST